MKIPGTGRWQWVLRVVAVAALQCCAGAIAQVTSGEKLPDALKEIRQAAGVCRRDDVLPVVDGALLAPELQPDLGCAISVAELQSLLRRPGAALIDLRSAGDHQVFHIEGALNLNRSDLHSKPYWRGKAVVLIADGKAERELYRECARLKQSGYKEVRVLRGGMPLWLAHSLPVTGRAPSAQQLARLSAAEFWMESQNPDNLIALGKEQNALQGDLSFSVVLPQTTGEAIKVLLERRRKELKGAPLASVVLAAAPAVTDEQIQRLQLAVMPVPLLVYAGNRDVFVRQLAVQKAIWTAQARGPKQPGCGL
jgi:rhodanese-related sulfurtransferase